MSRTAVTTNIDEALDVKVNLFPKPTLNPKLVVNKLTKAVNFPVSKFIHPGTRVNTSLG
jgi:hypothetical protein